MIKFFKKKEITNLLIFSHNNNYNIQVFNRLSDTLKKKILISNIITIDKKNINDLETNFKNSKIILLENLIKKRSFIKDEIILNKKIIKKYKNCEIMFYKMLDFVKIDDTYFKKKEKINAYKYYLKVILNYLKFNKINIVFFSHVPHTFFDVLFIQVCKINKIKVIFTRAYLMPGFYLFENNLFFTSPNIKIAKIKKNKIADTAIKQFIKYSRSKFNLIDIKKNIWVDYSLIHHLSKSSFINKLYFFKFLFKKIFKYLFRMSFIILKLFKLYLTDLLKGNNFNNFDNYHLINESHKKKNNNKIDHKLTKFDIEMIYLKTDLKKIYLLKYYLRLCSKINFNDNYIYFPLWFQPSSTTYPFADKNIDYIKCINLLSKSLPKNWKIFVKESPDIFNLSKHAWFKGTYTRNKKFYQKLKKIKNVKLVNFNIPDYKLIDNSIATASHADKFGLVSVLRYKPNLNFSNSIQRYCHGTFICKNLKDIKMNIKIIKNGFKFNKKKVINFNSMLSNRLFYRNTIKGFNKYESKTKFSKISELLENQIFTSL